MNVEEAVAAWIDRDAPSLVTKGWAQVDLDELLEPLPAFGARAGVDCLLEMRRYAQQFERTDPVLVLPLEAAPALVTTPASLRATLEHPWQYGPGLEVPSLYLVSFDLWRVHEYSEDYRVTILEDEINDKGLISYYRCWRSRGEAERGWEYSRAFYIRAP